MFIFRILHAVPYSNKPAVKDVIARLHSYFTCNLLIGLAILLSYKQFGGHPMECMTPLGFTSAWNQYAENYCFSENTYYIPFDQEIENFLPEQRQEKRVSYYQWMSFFLLFQCACFKFPTLIWRYFASQSGIKIGEVLRLATSESNTEPQNCASNISSLCVHLQNALRFHDRLKKRRVTPHKILFFLNLKYSSHYVTFIYFFAKFAFMLNVVCQVALLNRYFFETTNSSFGFDIWQNLLRGNTSWHESGLFPRVTMCDFEVREMGQTQNHTIQCVLLLNIFSEKIFVILWGWYILLATFTLCNISSWLMLFFNQRSAEHFIFNHLEMSGQRVFSVDETSGLMEIQEQVGRFIRKYLKSDGLLILQLISQHADIVFTTDLIYKLWESHYFIEKQREALRLTERRWQQHLRRLSVIEDRGMGVTGDGGADGFWRRHFYDASDAKHNNDYVHIPFSPSKESEFSSTPRHYRFSSKTSTPKAGRHVNISPTKRSILAHRSSKASLMMGRRTMSAESLPDSLPFMDHSSDSDNDLATAAGGGQESRSSRSRRSSVVAYKQTRF